MAEFRVPFATTEALQTPFKLDDAFADPLGRKRILLNADNLQVVCKRETISSEIGDIAAITFHAVGTIEYLCNAYPIVASDPETYRVHRFDADFNNEEGTRAYDCVDTAESYALGWLSSSGSKTIDIVIGATTCFNTCEVEIPTIESVTVADFAVDNNLVSELNPICSDCGEEEKRVVKWRGCFVITTSNE